MYHPSQVKALEQYLHRYPDEYATQARFVELVSNTQNCFQRDCYPGHITGSAWVVNPGKNSVLLVHHRKLNIWVQPGGHCDGESDVLNVARREVLEETGLDASPLQNGAIFDLDIHRIPAWKGQAEHWHYDIRFLLEGDDSCQLKISEESHDLAWVSMQNLAQYSQEESIQRMVRKTGNIA